MLNGCSLFETRTPEAPDDDSTIFIPPTTPQIVVENLLESVKQKNKENYSACFSTANYSFIPSNDAVIRFTSLFDQWSINDERNYILSLATALGKSNSINIFFSNSSFISLTSDSAVFITDYNISFDLQNSSYPTEYAGKSTFTLVPTQAGLWTILRWQDFSQSDAEITNETWSNLKAYYHN